MNETGINNDEMDIISDNLLGVQSEANRAAIPVSNKRKAPFVPDRKDSYFALFAFVLGFLFARWVLFAWQGWEVIFAVVCPVVPFNIRSASITATCKPA
jgi:hypothetical protein